MTELKGCPFCGGEPHLMLNACEGWHVRYIQCDCGARAKEFVYTQPELARAEAIRAWNTRVPAVQDEGMVERTERAIIDAIEAQFDIHAMDPEDWAEMSVAINHAIQAMSLYAETISSESSS